MRQELAQDGAHAHVMNTRVEDVTSVANLAEGVGATRGVGGGLKS